MLGTTVVPKLNQGSVRHRGVIDGGALFGYFLGKQKVTKKNNSDNISATNRIFYLIHELKQ